MPLPNELRNLRKYLLAAQRSLDDLRRVDPAFRMDLDGIAEGLSRAWDWTEEYTYSLERAQEPNGL